MSSGDLAISVQGISKAYTITHNAPRHSTLIETLIHRARNPLQRTQSETFWALKDVSFDAKKGEVIGIVGSNGAGKSTLLKILSRITEPTGGQIDLYGRVGSLLEVGTGFHGELSGRENIYLNGQILGMRRKEIDRHFDAIVDFANVEQFIDTPVKRYSSGMYVRLAFAVAAHLEPEILIVDEVLAVGDVGFQQKCLGKMQEVSSREGKTVLFVSHNMAAVRSLCTRAILLSHGRIAQDSSVDKLIETYLRDASTQSGTHRFDERDRAECNEVRLICAEVLDKNEKISAAIECLSPFSIRVEYEVKTRVINLRIGYTLRNQEGVVICGSADAECRDDRPIEPGIYQSVVHFDQNPLNQGTYSVLVGVSFPPHLSCVIFTSYVLHFRMDDTTGFGPECQSSPGVIKAAVRWSVAPVSSPNRTPVFAEAGA